MGSQSDSDPTVASLSSITLLQERFRQLEKVKERREEQQLLQKLSETDHQRVVCTTRHFNQQPAKFPFDSDIVVPVCSTAPADHSLSLGLNLQPSSTHSWPNNTKAAAAAASASTKSFDNSNLIDTSLHL
ncbi:hypothetical protein D8674_035795 [Pyrus ussuriensis x Pyrus communis]|uniref:Uncharacterized protein n=1 Tax=Pyrus ussuriensis x Pyrus communis TaxID=2448454 RepID=A0A5N5GIV5_9ROSA|nr:hypothetical protein D8674_018716 [Pyrus ussuriensis x Pyrus communis]KAB2613479.1 hypothetical protein D8674_035795 [Pyrus ussuriensis x Pyrus communis]